MKTLALLLLGALLALNLLDLDRRNAASGTPAPEPAPLRFRVTVPTPRPLPERAPARPVVPVRVRTILSA